MLSDSVHRRRMAYRRSHTLSTLPTDLVQEVDQEDNTSDQDTVSLSERSKLITSTRSPSHSVGSATDLSSVKMSASSSPSASTSTSQTPSASDKLTNPEKVPSSTTNKKRAPKRSSSNVSHTSSKSLGSGTPTMSSRSSTGAGGGNGVLRSLSGSSADVRSASRGAAGSSAAASARSKRFGRTPSTPSIILNKVKDRIREKMFTGDWSHGAAIIQERRQRSVDAFEARRTKSRRSLEKDDIDIEQVPLKEINKKKRTRMKSDPVPAVVLTNADEISPADAARMAFRRRSISEDTYDRRPCLPKIKLGNPDNTAGIICSNEDLQAIAGQSDIPRPGLKRSPQTSKRCSLEPQGSMDSSTSTYSSRSAKAISLDAESPGERQELLAHRAAEPEDPASGPSTSLGGPHGSVSPQYPEVILEKKQQAKDSLVTRSSSVTSGASSSGLPTTSRSGSKASVSERRRSNETKTDDDGRKSTDKSRVNNDGRSDAADEDADDDDEDKPKPVPEVVFDEFGQTWDVYGAEFDPEMVGDAIQRHLVKMMQRNQNKNADIKKSKDADTGKAVKGSDNVSFLLRFFCLFNNRRQTSS